MRPLPQGTRILAGHGVARPAMKTFRVPKPQRCSRSRGAYAPTRVPTGALAGRSRTPADPEMVGTSLLPGVFREGAEHCTRGACAPIPTASFRLWTIELRFGTIFPPSKGQRAAPGNQERPRGWFGGGDDATCGSSNASVSPGVRLVARIASILIVGRYTGASARPVSYNRLKMERSSRIVYCG